MLKKEQLNLLSVFTFLSMIHLPQPTIGVKAWGMCEEVQEWPCKIPKEVVRRSGAIVDMS